MQKKKLEKEERKASNNLKSWSYCIFFKLDEEMLYMT